MREIETERERERERDRDRDRDRQTDRQRERVDTSAQSAVKAMSSGTKVHKSYTKVSFTFHDLLFVA